MSLKTPVKIRTFQRKLYLKAKAEPEDRFYLLYDKIYWEDILLHAYRLAKAKGGGAGVDGIIFKMPLNLNLRNKKATGKMNRRTTYSRKQYTARGERSSSSLWQDFQCKSVRNSPKSKLRQKVSQKWDTLHF